MQRFEYKCKLSKNVIEYECNDETKEAFFEYTEFDANLPKTYFVLLRSSIDALKNKGYKYIVQKVSQEDWRSLSQDKRWKIKNVQLIENRLYYVIICDINDAIECISKGLGVDIK